MLLLPGCLFFFVKQKTAYEMRISDWSSDVCSSDLVATDPGASPEQLEAAVARPIENAISTIGSVRHVSTTINDSVVTIMIEFTYEKQTEQAVLDVRDAVSRIRSTLPTEMQEPVVSRVEIAGLPMMSYAVSSPSMDDAEIGRAHV